MAQAVVVYSKGLAVKREVQVDFNSVNVGDLLWILHEGVDERRAPEGAEVYDVVRVLRVRRIVGTPAARVVVVGEYVGPGHARCEEQEQSNYTSTPI